MGESTEGLTALPMLNAIELDELRVALEDRRVKLATLLSTSPTEKLRDQINERGEVCSSLLVAVHEARYALERDR